MPATLDALDAFLGDGDEIRTRLRKEYFRLRKEPGFEIGAFLQPYRDEIRAWSLGTQQILKVGFNSHAPRVSFTNAKSSAQFEHGTNIDWGGLIAYLDAKLEALSNIIRNANPDSLRPITDPRSVFLVHGRSDDWNTATSTYLAELGFSIITLEDQPNLGQTLIEKFEANANVGAAIVLFTADDVGCLKDDLESTGLVPRPRQNVLIELGFFFGRLGRNRVCLLKEPTIEEFPSDLHGIVYTEITLSADSDWREQLVRELTAMGLRAQAGSIAGSG